MSDKNIKVQYYVAFVVSLAAVTASASFSWTTPVLPKFHNNETNFNITDHEISWMVAMPSPGVVTGSLVVRFMSDRYGRRTSILASAFPFIFGTVFALYAVQAWMLYVARFLWGCAAGMVAVISPIYLAEISDKDIRGTLNAGNRFMFNFGSFIVLAVGSFVSYQTLSYMLIVLPACYFLACLWIPETPYYLLKDGKVNIARKELLKLNKYKDEKVLEDKLSAMRSDVRNEMRRSGTLKEYITGKQYRKATIIAVGLRIVQLLSGSIAIQQYLGRIMQDSKSGISVSVALTIFGAIRFVSGVLSSVIIDRVGRRILLITSFFAGGMCLSAVGAYFYFQEVVGIDHEETNLLRYMTFIGIVCYNISATLGFDTLSFVIPGEIFPLNVKSVAMTAINIFSAILTFSMVKGYQFVKDLSGLYGVFWFFGTFSFAGVFFSYYVVPETKGKSLREIQLELQGDLYDKANGKLNQVLSSNVSKNDEELKQLNEKHGTDEKR